MPHQHPRRRLRKAAHALGVGTALAIARSASASWHHALVEQRCPAFLNSPSLRARSGSRGNCNRPAESLGVLSTTPPPAVVPRALTMKSSDDRSPGTQGRFGKGESQQRGPPAGGPSTSGRMSHAASQRAGPLKATSMLLHDEPTKFGGRHPFASRAARWFLRRAIANNTKQLDSLQVEVEARSNWEAMQGRLDTVSVEFEKMSFPSIQVTGGARCEFLGVDLLTLGLLPGPLSRLRRLRAPCEVSGIVNLTDVDLTYSPAIRNIAQQVVNHVLKPFDKESGGNGGSARATTTSSDGVVDGGKGREREQEQEQAEGVVIRRVHVLGNKLAVEGMVPSLEPYMRFRCEFSLSTSSDMHVVRFKDPSFSWEMPNRYLPLPMLPLQPFDIGLGDRARIENLIISNGTVSVGGRFVLSPVGPLRVSQGFKNCNIEHDLAETLSVAVCNILRFRRD